MIVTIFCLTQPSHGSELSSSPELVVHLLDYLAKDYGGAVSNGKIVSKSEYAEQVEFAEIVEKNSRGVEKLNNNPSFMAGIGHLQKLILEKGSADDVSKLARKLQQNAISLAEIEVAPSSWPDLANGAKFFQTYCVSCHGSEGRGDGMAGKNLDPKPANFHDPDLVWNSAPYKFYNTIRLGVPGTGMAAFSHLSDQDVWALAFYVKSLPYAKKYLNSQKPSTLNLHDTAILTDMEIADRMGGRSDDVVTAIGSLRASSDGPKDKDPLLIADELLNESVRFAKAGDFAGAGSVALRAYLEGIEPVEPKMRANWPGFVEEIESLMSEYRSSLNKKESITKIEIQKKAISQKLKEAQTLFSEKKMSPGVAFGAAFSIFLREGFEAVLIIIVLLSILRAMGESQAIKWVHFGWIFAVIVGVVGWFASGILLSMSGLNRELLEGGISLLAVAVLLYVGFWLHRYSEIKKWRAFLEAKLRRGLTKGSYLALALVAFMAVFREAFEVILFLRAIWIDLDPSGQTIAGSGVLSSFLLLGGLSYFVVRESRKLPLGILFQVCSWTMIVLAFILAGKGVHSLQEAGLIPASTVALNFRFDLVGIYPSMQTLSAQAFVVLMFLWVLLNERRAILITQRMPEDPT